MDKNRKCMYCPILKEMCVEGWTKSMGEDLKTGERPKCRFWITVKGKNPQSEEFFDEGDCSIAWAPTLQLESTQKILGVAAAIESLRNQIAKQGQTGEGTK